MRLALTNLDTGLFFAQGGWIRDPKLAEVFSDPETVATMAVQQNVRNAGAAVLRENAKGGSDLTGFLWGPEMKLGTMLGG